MKEYHALGRKQVQDFTVKSIICVKKIKKSMKKNCQDCSSIYYLKEFIK